MSNKDSVPSRQCFDSITQCSFNSDLFVSPRETERLGESWKKIKIYIDRKNKRGRKGCGLTWSNMQMGLKQMRSP